MHKNTGRLRERITKALTDSMEEPEVARDIAFHMTDWDNDFQDIVRLYDRLEELSDEEIVQIIIGFLVHVPNHIAAAKKLIGLGPMEDIFEVGILEEDEE